MGPNQIDVNNLNLTSNNGNVELVNQQVNVAQNMNVKADDFIVRAGKSTFESENSSRSSGAGVSFNPLAPITPANFTPSVNYSQSNGNMEGTTYNNSHITVGGNTTINTTGDMILSGADLVTNTIDGNIGGQLVIESLQDTVTGSNSGFGANISLPTVAEKKNAETGKDTPAHRSPTVGGSVTDGSVDKAWTSDQSSLIAKNGGTINVGSTTTVTGAVVVSENVDKPLIINTTELITNNLEDSDESTNTTIGFSGISESTPVPKTQYTYDNTDKEQSTLATMSNVVVNTGSGQVDLASKGINTDISKAQEVTKDEETHIDIPIPTDLLNSDTWKEFSNQFQQLIATPGDIIEGVQAALSDGSGTTTIDGHKLTTTNLTPYEEIKNNIIGTNAGISCSQSEACKNYEKLIEKYELPDGTYMNGYINPITNEYVPGITDVAAGALRIILTEAGKGDYDIKFVTVENAMGQAKIYDDTKTMIVNLSKMDITDLEQVTNVGVHESQRFTYENKDTDTESLNKSDPKDEIFTSTPEITDFGGKISSDTNWYYNTDLSGYRDATIAVISIATKAVEKDLQKVKDGTDNYLRIIKFYGTKKALESMELNAFSDIKSKNIGPFGKKLFAIYGADDKIRNSYLEELPKDGYYKNFTGVTGVLYLDKHMPDETKRLWNNPKSLEISNGIVDKWEENIGKEISFDKRLPVVSHPDFTFSNSEFYALGSTTLKASTYGTITKQKDSKGNVNFSVDIVIRMHYRDAFYDVLNVNPLSGASQNNKPKEMVGGKAFAFETEIKVIKIKKGFSSLKDLSTEIQNEMKK